MLSTAQIAFSKSDESCLAVRNDITLMIQVKDYPAQLKATDWAIKNCKEYSEKYSLMQHLSDMEQYYSYYAMKAEALLGLGKNEEALKTSQECIDKKYSTVDCHLSKWKALMRLGRSQEAKDHKKTLYFIIQNKINLVNQVDISSQRKELQPSLNELKKSELYKLEVYKDFLDRSD